MSSDISAEVWKPLLAYIYTGELILPETGAFMESVISAARILQMDHLLRACGKGDGKPAEHGEGTETPKTTVKESVCTVGQDIGRHQNTPDSNTQESAEFKTLEFGQDTGAFNEKSSSSTKQHLHSEGSALVNRDGFATQVSSEVSLINAVPTDNQPSQELKSKEVMTRGVDKDSSKSVIADQYATGSKSVVVEHQWRPHTLNNLDQQDNAATTDHETFDESSRDQEISLATPEEIPRARVDIDAQAYSQHSILFQNTIANDKNTKGQSSNVLPVQEMPAVLKQVEQHSLDSEKFVVFQTPSSEFHILDTSDLNTSTDTVSLKLAAENADIMSPSALILEQNLMQSDVASEFRRTSETDKEMNSSFSESLQTFSSSLVQFIEIGPDVIGVKQYLCLVCNKTVSDIHKHTKEHEFSKIYECVHCGQKYKNRFVLKRHIEYSHPKDTEVASCPKCQKSFRTRYHLKRHLAIACDNSRLWQCSICLRKIKRKTDFDLHMALHTGFKPHVCRICFKGFPALKRLRAHMSVHETGEYSCHCGKVFNCEKNYKYHFNYAHNMENPYRCQVCFRSGRSEGWLRKHSLTHTKAYLCKHCKKGFDTEKGLLLHEKMHLIRDANPLECPICQKTLKSRRTLQRHMMDVHKESSGFKCNQCGKYYSSEKSLNEHMESHLRSGETMCKVCKLQFNDVAKLKEHMVGIHNITDGTVPKIFMCVLCKQFFNTESEFKSHESTHDTPVHCKFCKNKFETLSKLRCHQCSKLYCLYCEALFKTPKAVERHTELHLRGKVCFKCEHCTDTFATVPAKRNHCQEKHFQSPLDNDHSKTSQIDSQNKSKLRVKVNESIGTTYTRNKQNGEDTEYVHTHTEESFKIDLFDIQKAANEILPVTRNQISETIEKVEVIDDGGSCNSSVEVADIGRIKNMLMNLS